MNAPGRIDDALPSQPSVLLVDDDEVNLLLTSIALRERGFAITEATSGEAAIEKLAEWVPDVLVLDAVMPGLDGFETCREVRRLAGFKSLPVLMLTGLDDDASITRAYEAGATDFFVKSTHWSLLAGRLRYLLRSSHTLHELERSKAKLARAQDLARMGSFDWRPAHGGLAMSHEGLRVFGRGPGQTVRPARAGAHDPGERAQGLPAHAARRGHHRLGADHRRVDHARRRPPPHHPRRGRARVQRPRHAGRLHRHRAGRDRPPRGRGQDPPPRQLRHPDRPAQPAPADLAHRTRARGRPPPGPPDRAAADRPGRLQAHQRHPGPFRRRRAADRGGAPPALLRAPQRPGDGRGAGGSGLAIAPRCWRRWAGSAATSSSRCCPTSPTRRTPSAWPGASSS